LNFFFWCGKSIFPVEPAMIKLIKSELAGRKGMNGQCSDLKGGSLLRFLVI